MQLILPQELYDVIWKDVEAKISNIQYSRVIMSLSDILEGDFFNKYIKIGTSNSINVFVDLLHVMIGMEYVCTLLISSSLVRQYLDAL